MSFLSYTFIDESAWPGNTLPVPLPISYNNQDAYTYLIVGGLGPVKVGLGPPDASGNFNLPDQQFLDSNLTFTLMDVPASQGVGKYYIITNEPTGSEDLGDIVPFNVYTYNVQTKVQEKFSNVTRSIMTFTVPVFFSSNGGSQGPIVKGVGDVLWPLPTVLSPPSAASNYVTMNPGFTGSLTLGTPSYLFIGPQLDSNVSMITSGAVQVSSVSVNTTELQSALQRAAQSASSSTIQFAYDITTAFGFALIALPGVAVHSPYSYRITSYKSVTSNGSVVEATLYYIYVKGSTPLPGGGSAPTTVPYTLEYVDGTFGASAATIQWNGSSFAVAAPPASYSCVTPTNIKAFATNGAYYVVVGLASTPSCAPSYDCTGPNCIDVNSSAFASYISGIISTWSPAPSSGWSQLIMFLPGTTFSGTSAANKNIMSISLAYNGSRIIVGMIYANIQLNGGQWVSYTTSRGYNPYLYINNTAGKYDTAVSVWPGSCRPNNYKFFPYGDQGAGLVVIGDPTSCV